MKKKIISTFVICALLAVASEWFYFQLVFHDKTNDITVFDTVLVYGGKYARSVQGLALA